MTVIEGAQSMPGEMSVINDAPPHHQSAKWSQDLKCPQCQLGYLTSRHCKSVCELCGYIESCEDIFPSQERVGYDSEHQSVQPGGPSVAVKTRAILGGMG